MYSDLKRLISILIFFSVISVLCSILSLLLLINYKYLLDGPMFFVFCYLVIIVPIIFISLAIIMNRIIKSLISRDISLIERFREIEKEQK